MSTINGNYGYNNFYNSNGLFGSTASSNDSYSSIYDLLSSSYGVNNAVKDTFMTSSAIRSAGEKLDSILSELTATGTKSAFNQLNAVSDNEKTATASLDLSKVKDVSELKGFQLNVGQVATAQVNSGDALSTTGKEVSSGQYRFEIEIGGSKKAFSINVSAGDNNESIQQKMAATINDAKLGITASIDYDNKGKESTLKLTATSTGNKNTNGGDVFTVRDTTGGLASRMGITNVSQEAQNASYSIGSGPRQYSASNKIDLGNGVSVNLQQAGTTQIDFSKNSTGVIDKVKDLVGAINGAMASASGSVERGSSRLFNDLFQMTKAYSSTLERIGVNVSSAGVLSIDEDKLSEAAKEGGLAKIGLESMFQSNSSGFARRLERITGNMTSSQYYADPVKNSASGSNTYYDKYASVSSLLDMYF